MSKKEKLIKRFLSEPKEFTFEELTTLLSFFGYSPNNKGKTSGSRCEYISAGYRTITLHRPHPSNVLKTYQIQQIKELLKSEGLL